jgi:hypothetical protein
MDINLAAGFEPAVPAIEWPHTYALHRMATGIGKFIFMQLNNLHIKRASEKCYIKYGQSYL